MTKRILSFILAVLTLFALWAPAFASAEPEAAPAVPAEDALEPETMDVPDAGAPSGEPAEQPGAEEPSGEPEAAPGPEVTQEPEPTLEPEITPEPEPADLPSEEPSGEPTDAPEPAALPASLTVSSVTPSIKEYEAFLPVLEAYYDAFYYPGGSSSDELYKYASSIVFFYGSCDFYYTFYDLDKNGSAELYIAYDHPDLDSYAITDIFALVNGDVKGEYGPAEGLALMKHRLIPLSNGEVRIHTYYGIYTIVSIGGLVGSSQANRPGAGYVIRNGFAEYYDSNNAPMTQAQVNKIDNRGRPLVFTGWKKFLSRDMKRDGWVRDGGKTFYYIHNIPQVGIQYIYGDYYYFSPKDGHMMTGLVNTGDGIRYFSAKDGHMLTGLVTVDSKGHQCYFSAKDGRRLTGLLNTGGGIRYFSAKTGYMLKGLVTVDNKGHQCYFSAKDGRRLTGLVNTGGGIRYFSAKTGYMLKGLVTVDSKGHQCYFSAKTGHRLKGLVTTDNKGTKRFFSLSTGYMAKNQWVYVNGIRYYANANGIVTRR